MNRTLTARALALLIPALLLGACQDIIPSENNQKRLPELPVNPDSIPDAVPQNEPLSAKGNGPQLDIGGKQFQVLDHAGDYVERGIATWYPTNAHGQMTVNQEIHDMYKMTAAHNTLPIPSYAKITHLRSNRSIIVRINDRSAMADGQIIRLSLAAASKLGLGDQATSFVEVRGIETRPRHQAPKVRTAQPVRPQGQALPASKPQAAQKTNPPKAQRARDSFTNPSRYELGTIDTPAPDRPAAPTANRRTEYQAPGTPSSPALGSVYLQAGAFRQQANAEKILGQLKQARVNNAFVDQANTSVGRVHRVRIGPFANRTAAEREMENLRRKGIKARVAAHD